MKFIMPFYLAAIGILLSFVAGCATNNMAETSYDGLVRQSDSQFDAFYIRPGASLAGKRAYSLSSCEVAFRKNWLRDQNTDRIDLSKRVTKRDVIQIKTSLARQCDKFFREALQEKPAYRLVDDRRESKTALILRPEIINLDINAPEVSGGRPARNYTTSFGEMTLSLEIVDGTTSEVIARVVDRRRGPDSGYLKWTNGVTNRADSDRILRRWASQLRKALDRATTE